MDAKRWTMCGVAMVVLLLSGCGDRATGAPVDGSPGDVSGDAAVRDLGAPDAVAVDAVPGPTSWVKALDWPASRSGVLGVGSDCAGNVYGTGRLKKTETLGGTTLQSRGGQDVLLFKLDRTGQVVWARSAGGPGHDSGKGVTVAADGRVLVTGNLGPGATFGTIKPAGVVGEHCGFVAALDSGGAFQWVTPVIVSKTGFLFIGEPAVDAAGNVVVASYYSGTLSVGGKSVTSADVGFDLVVFKLDKSGKVAWVTGGPGKGETRATQVAPDATGNAYVGGWFVGSMTLGSTTITSRTTVPKGQPHDAFLARLGPDGAFSWAISAGGVHDDEGMLVAVHPSGDVLWGGEFMDTATFGARKLTVSGGAAAKSRDLWVARVSPKGAYRWVVQQGGVGEDMLSGLGATAGGDVVLSAAATVRGGELATTGTYLALLDGSGQRRWSVWAGRADDVMDTGRARSSGLRVGCDGHLVAHGPLDGTVHFPAPAATVTGGAASTGGTGNYIWKLALAWPCLYASPCLKAGVTGGRCVTTPLADGTACTEAGKSGVCAAGRCCTGCVDTGKWPICYAGVGASRCGAGGGTCKTCPDVDCTGYCSAGKCTYGKAPDGASCATGTQTGLPGVCQSGACCDGCVSGSTCYPGNTAAQCGKVGGPCQTCTAGAKCSSGTCYAP